MSSRDALKPFSGSLAESIRYSAQADTFRSKQTKLYSVAVVFAVLGFMFGACADQYKTFAGTYKSAIEVHRSCSFGP
jgi:hypothetical protein